MTADITQRATQRAAAGRDPASAAGEHPRTVELTWIGNGGWRAIDTSVPADDAGCVIAYLQCIERRVEVTWIGSRRPPSCFTTLRDAYTALNLERD